MDSILVLLWSNTDAIRFEYLNQFVSATQISSSFPLTSPQLITFARLQLTSSPSFKIKYSIFPPLCMGSPYVEIAIILQRTTKTSYWTSTYQPIKESTTSTPLRVQTHTIFPTPTIKEPSSLISVVTAKNNETKNPS